MYDEPKPIRNDRDLDRRAKVTHQQSVIHTRSATTYLRHPAQSSIARYNPVYLVLHPLLLLFRHGVALHRDHHGVDGDV